MPFKDKIDPVKSSPGDAVQLTIDALEKEIATITLLRDNSMAQATNEEQRELARVAWQKEIDKAAAQLAQERQRLEALREE